MKCQKEDPPPQPHLQKGTAELATLRLALTPPNPPIPTSWLGSAGRWAAENDTIIPHCGLAGKAPPGRARSAFLAPPAEGLHCHVPSVPATLPVFLYLLHALPRHMPRPSSPLPPCKGNSCSFNIQGLCSKQPGTVLGAAETPATALVV